METTSSGLQRPPRRARHSRPVLAAAALALLIGAAIADPDSASSVPTLSDSELQTAYAEVEAIGGMSYTYYLGATPDEAKLDAVLARVGPAPTESYLEKLGLKKSNSYAFVMPVSLRDVVIKTQSGRVSGKFRIKDSWCFVYVAGVRFVPLPPLEQLKDALPKLVQAGNIPAPADALRPPLLYAYQASQVHDVAALARLSADVDVNLILPNGSTMLANAVAGGTSDLITALLDRHADPNKCAASVCPLTLAVYAKNAPELLQLLLARGANPNITDPDAGVLATPLAMAVMQANGNALGELLLAKGANVDGIPGDPPPVVAAAEKGDRAVIEMLEHHGADLMRQGMKPPLPVNALTVAQRANADPKFQAWLREQWKEAARKSGRFDWQGWIEQDGKQMPIADRPIVLSRKPFNIVIRMRPEARLMIAASAEKDLLEDAQDSQRQGSVPLHSLGAVVADQCDGAERPLFMSGPSTNPKLMGGGDRVMLWEDAPGCHAFTSLGAGPTETRYVRTIGSLSFYDSQTSISESSATSLFLVLGTQLQVAFPQFDFFGEKRIELRFH